MSTEKKGLSPIAWIAIGCGGIGLLGLVIFGVLAFIGIQKGKEFIEEAEKNPGVAVAKAIAWANPEIELVNTDEANQTVTFKNTTSGEEFTVNFKDLEEGRVEFSSNGELVTFEADQTGDGGTSITTNEGTARFGGGLGDAKLPEWLPVFDGAGVEGSMISDTSDLHSGFFTLVIPEGKADAVYDYYKNHFTDLGMEINESTFSVDGGNSKILTAKNAGETQNVTLTINMNPTDGVSSAVQFSHAKN